MSAYSSLITYSSIVIQYIIQFAIIYIFACASMCVSYVQNVCPGLLETKPVTSRSFKLFLTYVTGRSFKKKSSLFSSFFFLVFFFVFFFFFFLAEGTFISTTGYYNLTHSKPETCTAAGRECLSMLSKEEMCDSSACSILSLCLRGPSFPPQACRHGHAHTPSTAFRHLPPNSEHRFLAPSSKLPDLVTGQRPPKGFRY